MGFGMKTKAHLCDTEPKQSCKKKKATKNHYMMSINKRQYDKMLKSDWPLRYVFVSNLNKQFMFEALDSTGSSTEMSWHSS